MVSNNGDASGIDSPRMDAGFTASAGNVTPNRGSRRTMPSRIITVLSVAGVLAACGVATAINTQILGAVTEGTESSSESLRAAEELVDPSAMTPEEVAAAAVTARKQQQIANIADRPQSPVPQPRERDATVMGVSEGRATPPVLPTPSSSDSSSATTSPSPDDDDSQSPSPTESNPTDTASPDPSQTDSSQTGSPTSPDPSSPTPSANEEPSATEVPANN